MAMYDRISGKVFLVTGSTQGIGRELARLILDYGGKVIINGRYPSRDDHVQAVFREHKDCVHYVPADISVPADCERLVSASVKVFGRLDAIILNAGISCYGEVMELTPSVSSLVITTNITSAFHLLHFALPHILQTKGSVLLISSIAGLYGLPKQAPYCASKMALISLVQSLSVELDGTGAFAGVAVLSFTANDEGKSRLAASGAPVPVPSRAKWATAPVQTTARKILTQLVKRRTFVIHSMLGRISWMITRFMPGVFRFSVIRLSKKTPF